MVHLVPRSVLGGWSAFLTVAFFVLVAAGQVLVKLEQGGQEIAVTSGLPIVASVSAMVAGIGAFVTGTLAIFRNRDRSLAVFIAILVGGALIILTIGTLFISGWFH
jgi:hypothetical protein